ncbi:hypothetical protein A0H81_09824 [Grifola frondosa]|uniref:Uncharacterized protein n=1 Tax=Grifola frondosa TaxID=5627 RepID=A0A1C7M088_GRIFR|nr:hypothetical protein A0H81_09824 [Grifola frondosa]
MHTARILLAPRTRLYALPRQPPSEESQRVGFNRNDTSAGLPRCERSSDAFLEGRAAKANLSRIVYDMAHDTGSVAGQFVLSIAEATPTNAILKSNECRGYSCGRFLPYHASIVPQDFAPVFRPNPTTGSILAGVILGWIFYACTCGQSIYYARKYPNDRLPLKLLVACLWLLDTSTIILDTQFFWYLAIEHHGDPDVLPVPNTFIAAFFLISLTNCIVQCYFVFNIWRLLSRRWYRLPALIMGLTLAVTSLAGGIPPSRSSS